MATIDAYIHTHVTGSNTYGTHTYIGRNTSTDVLTSTSTW